MKGHDMPKLTHLLCALFAAGAFILTPVSSQALVKIMTEANTTDHYWLNMRMGPSTNYNVVRVLQPGSTVMVRSCQSDWSWCLVSHHGIQGYVSARYINRDGIDVNTGSHGDLIPVNDAVEYHEAYYLR